MTVTQASWYSSEKTAAGEKPRTDTASQQASKRSGVQPSYDELRADSLQERGPKIPTVPRRARATLEMAFVPRVLGGAWGTLAS